MTAATSCASRYSGSVLEVFVVAARRGFGYWPLAGDCAARERWPAGWSWSRPGYETNSPNDCPKSGVGLQI